MTTLYDEIFSLDDLKTLFNILKNNKKTITVAESCTGGLIASFLTSIAGSSSIFNGSIVTYSNDIKEQELNVKKETLIKHGAVSKEVVKEMLEGVIDKFKADYALAVSGIAGPGGATKDKPVGMVVIGILEKNKEPDIEIIYLNGTRNEIQIQAAKKILAKILKNINLALDKKEKNR